MESRAARAGWAFMVLGAVLTVLVSVRYSTLNPETYFPRQRAVYEANTAALLVHIAAIMVALLLGPLQFLRGFRARRRTWHRASGRVFIVAALVGSLAGLYIAPKSASGVVSDVAFTWLALITVVAVVQAFRAIRAGRVQAHREWMTRAYALVFAGVTLRLYLPVLEMLMGEQDGYALVSWLAWVPNLLVAEWMVRRQRRQPTTEARGRAVALSA